MVPKTDTYLIRYGELVLKGKNRDRFVAELVKQVRIRIKPLGGRIQVLHKKLLVQCEAEPEQVKTALSTVFGLTSISPIWRLPHDLDAVKERSWQLLEKHAGSDQTFAVRAKRAFKQFPMNSMEVGRDVAGSLLQRGLNLKVNLKQADLSLGIIIDFKEIWLFLESWKGLGGLPISPTSRHALLLSGGIDSPVAGNLIQKRGGMLCAVYFHTPPFTVEAAKDKVVDLASILAQHQGHLKLFVVNFTEVMKTIRAECHPAYMVILARRLMMRTTTALVEKLGFQSIVTGESLGQVASQTIENIGVINEGVPYPILRPLIGMDKQDIVEVSKRMGAYDISIRPFDDCCSLFSPKEPVTRAKPQSVKREEAKLDVDQLVAGALELVEEIPLEADFS